MASAPLKQEVSVGVKPTLVYESNHTGEFAVSGGFYGSRRTGDEWRPRGTSRRVKVVAGIVQGSSGQTAGLRIAKQYQMGDGYWVQTTDYEITAGAITGVASEAVGTGDRPAVSASASNKPDGNSVEVYSPGDGNGMAWITEDLHGCDSFAVLGSAGTGFTASGVNAAVGTEE